MEKLHHFLKFMRTDTNIELISISLGKNQKIISCKNAQHYKYKRIIKLNIVYL